SARWAAGTPEGPPPAARARALLPHRRASCPSAHQPDRRKVKAPPEGGALLGYPGGRDEATLPEMPDMSNHRDPLRDVELAPGHDRLGRIRRRAGGTGRLPQIDGHVIAPLGRPLPGKRRVTQTGPPCREDPQHLR